MRFNFYCLKNCTDTSDQIMNKVKLANGIFRTFGNIKLFHMERKKKKKVKSACQKCLLYGSTRKWGT